MADQVDLNAPVAAAQAQKGQLNTLFSGQQNDVNNFSSGLSNFVNNFPSPDALATRIGGELGLPALRQNAQTLNTTFANLPSTYRDATRGYDVNANQLSRLTGEKAYEMAPAMTTANNALATGENQLSQRMGYAQQGFQNQLIPYQSQQQLLSDRLARETTGYTTQMSNELNALISKMQSGVTMNQGDLERANQLAIAEKGYANQLAVTKQQQAYIPIPGYGVYATQANNGNGALLGGLNGVPGNSGLITYNP